MVTECVNELSERNENLKRKRYDEDGRRCSLPMLPTSSAPYASGDGDETKELQNQSGICMPEILTHIFQFLPLDDRKNARLACKLWYDCCTRASIIAGEKFVFRADCSIPDIVEILFNSNVARMNLEFQDIVMDSVPSKMWQKCGHKVRSLRFHRCYLNENSLREIIDHCVNLASINIFKDQSFESNSDYFDNNLKSHMVLDYFIERGIKRTQLHSFAVIACHAISFDLLKKIFEVFPCIKHFSTRVKPADRGEEPFCLQSFTQLRSLTYSRGTHLKDLFWLERPMIPIWQLRLTKFETHLYGVPWSHSRKQTLYRFFSAQKDLKIINLEIKEAEFIKELTFHILKNCPKLRDFRFDCHHSDFKLSCNEVKNFLALISNLRCLTITCTFRAQSVPSESSSNLALEVLSLKNVSRCEELYSYILKHCPKVKHLQISWPSDRVLQETFKSVPNLRTLILDDAYNSTIYGFTGQRIDRRDEFSSQHVDREEGYSIKRLQRLQHLEICGAATLTGDVARECEFPHLKHLKCVDINLVDLVSNMPGIQTLVLYWYELNNLERTIQLCERLKNLSRLRVGNITVNSLKPLFEACPNLKYVWNQCEVFSFNRFTKQLSRGFEINFKFPGKESIFEG